VGTWLKCDFWLPTTLSRPFSSPWSLRACDGVLDDALAAIRTIALTSLPLHHAPLHGFQRATSIRTFVLTGVLGVRREGR
jgi:hypothetical protein